MVLKKKPTFEIQKHFLVPPHRPLSEEEKQQFLQKYNISIIQLPQIRADDSAVAHFELKKGDVVEITRRSPIKEYKYYRRVV